MRSEDVICLEAHKQQNTLNQKVIDWLEEPLPKSTLSCPCKGIEIVFVLSKDVPLSNYNVHHSFCMRMEINFAYYNISHCVQNIDYEVVYYHIVVENDRTILS